MLNINRPYWFTTGTTPEWEFVCSLPDKVPNLIIGAGVAGLLVGIELALKGQNCLILDNNIPGTRSSAKSDGMLFSAPINLNHFFNEISVAEQVKSMALGKLNLQLCKSVLNQYSTDNWCDINYWGSIRIANDIAQKNILDELCKIYHYLKTDSVILNAQTFKNITNIRFSHSAIYCPTDISLNPLLLVNGLVNMNRALGNKILGGFHFTNFNENGEVAVTDIYGNLIFTDNLIITLGAFTKQTNIQQIKAHLQSKRIQYITSLKHVNKDLTSVGPCNYVVGDGDEYFRLHNDRVIYGGCHNTLPDKELEIMADFKVSPQIANILFGLMAYRIDCIKTNDTDFIWTRNIAESKDKMPIVGKIPGYNNTYVSTGFGSHGLSYQFVAAKILANQILGNKELIYGSDILDPTRFI